MITTLDNRKIEFLHNYFQTVECPECMNRELPDLKMALFNYRDITKLERHRFIATCKTCKKKYIVCYNDVMFVKNSRSRIHPQETTAWYVEEPNLKTELKEVPAIIDKISPDFRNIYKEARETRKLEYTQICGGGYRKALEFLIKEYAIKLHPEDKESIAKMELGNCIAQYYDNTIIKTYAERASWLGNDELHYLKTWRDKDISDLEELVQQTMKAIELVEKGKELEQGMTFHKKKKNSRLRH